MRTTIYERNHRALLELCPDLPSLKPGDHRRHDRGEGSGLMPLSLDVLEAGFARRSSLGAPQAETRFLRVALSHHYEQNGDLVPDPDMELRVFTDPSFPRVEALAIQHATGHYARVYPRPGCVDPRQKRDQNAFLAVWLRNLKAQGFSLAPTLAGAV